MNSHEHLENDLDFENLFPYKRIKVFPEMELETSILEVAMIDTRIMQRLRFTKQLGNSNISYPTAEHSRFSHSLGVLNWVSIILYSLKSNFNKKNNNQVISELNESVKGYMRQQIAKQPKLSDQAADFFNSPHFFGVGWFDQLSRLYGLLHDITHIPFGHTIEDQACLLERHDDDLERLSYVFDKLSKEVSNSHHFKENEHTEILIAIAKEYIELIKSMFVIGAVTSEPKPGDKTRQDWLESWNALDISITKPLTLAYDIVSNTICADLMDYTLRDTLFSSMPRTFDKSLLGYLKVLTHKTIFYVEEKEEKEMFRLGVTVARKKVRHEIITSILDLLRIRYDLTEKVYYHHSKVILDAMLEKVLRVIPPNYFTAKIIYDKYLGDEGFLEFLETKINTDYKEGDGDEKMKPAVEILNKMFTRNLYKAVFRINPEEHLNKTGRANSLNCEEHTGRNMMEQQIIDLAVEKGAFLSPGDIIISYPPKKMQRKIAKALIEWPAGGICTFETLPKEKGYSDEVGMLTERYDSLWSMSVYINPEKIEYVRLIESICESLFDMKNDSILDEYLKAAYPKIYGSSATIIEIGQMAMALEANYHLAKTAKGPDTIPTSELVLDILNDAIQGKRKEKNEVKSETKDVQPDLGFKEE